MLCKACGGYRTGPCEGCVDGECAMNCGPAIVDVRGIFDAADAVSEATNKLFLTRPKEAYGRHTALHEMLTQIGLYGLWAQRHTKPANRPKTSFMDCLEESWAEKSGG